MGASWVIRLEHAVPEVGFHGARAETMAPHQHELDALAQELEVRCPSEFISFSAEDVDALVDDLKADMGSVGTHTERWFDAKDGLSVVRALAQYLRAHTDEVDDSPLILEELEAMEGVLDKASQLGIRFHITADY